MADQPPVVPSAWQLERAVSSWQQLRDHFANDPTLADDEEVVGAMLTDMDAPHPDVLLERAIDALIWIERREVEADDLRRDMVARRDRYAARAEAVRAIIRNLMVAIEKTSHRSRWGKATLAAGRPSLVLIDEQIIPDQYFKTERTIMKAPIIEALARGEDVPGAVMSNGGTILRIGKL